MADLNEGPNPIDMTTVGQAKDWIPGFRNNSAPDSSIQKIITATSRDVVKMLGAKVDHSSTTSPTYGMSTLNAQLTITERLDGNGSNVLWPTGRPIRNIVALQVNGWAPPINVAYGQQGVYIEKDGWSIAFGDSGFGSGTVQTVGWPSGQWTARFPMGRGNILLTYLAGYGIAVPNSNPQEFTTPDDLEEAVLMIIAYNYARRDRVGLDSENIAGTASTTYMKLAYPPEATAILQKYVRVPLGAQA